MSYDLYFRKKNKANFSLDEFQKYFSGRPNYQVEKGQAVYGNDDTGVYFVMDHNEIKSEQPSETLAGISPANLSLNFIRPHVFGLEAEPEVHAFVKAFDFLIHDPQNEGNPTEIYNTANRDKSDISLKFMV
jgi:hypothetical protein